MTTERKPLLRRSKDITSDLSLDLERLHEITPFVNRICDNLDQADEAIEERAKEIVEIAEEGNITSGKKPAAVAAAAIYNASLYEGERITQNKIATAADVTEVTIRSRYQGQQELL